MSESKETKKMKIIALYEQTLKQFEPDPNPHNSLFFAPKNLKNIALLLDEILDEIKSNIENKSCSNT